MNFLWLLRPSWKGKSQEHRAKSSPSDFYLHGLSLDCFYPHPRSRFRGRGKRFRLFELWNLVVHLFCDFDPEPVIADLALPSSG